MIRTQVQLSEQDFEELRRTALRLGRSMADCIREGVAIFIRRSGSRSDDLAEVAGRFRPVPGEAIKNHDQWWVESAQGRDCR